MKIQQEPKFQPITLVLETKEEAEWLWDLVNNRAAGPSENDQEKFYNALSNWFSRHAQLGGS
jgi:hypothetical protein